MEDKGPLEDNPKKTFGSISANWESMTEEEKLTWTENFLVSTGLYTGEMPKVETRWFLGKNSKRVFAVYKADFEGSAITNQQQWLIPNKDTGWRKTNQVMDWYFVGEDDLYPCTEDEAARYVN